MFEHANCKHKEFGILNDMIGIDEVGRGCWAGPLLIVAARQRSVLPGGLKDSKKLSKKQRETLILAIQSSCDLGEGWVEAAEIDKVGLTEAMELGVARALEAVGAAVDEDIIMDGTINYCPQQFAKVQCIARADDTHSIVSAASIYAKVTRDARMVELAKTHPKYGFDAHVGYGTKAHSTALKQYGVCALHRLSYKPIQALL